MSKDTIPSRTIQLKIEDKEYSISFPNTGQIIDIETMKSSYSRGEYNNISSVFANSETYKAKLLIDMITVFKVLIPTFRKDFGLDIAELDAIRSSKILKRSYIKIFLPWYNSWQKYLSDIDNEEDDE